MNIILTSYYYLTGFLKSILLRVVNYFWWAVGSFVIVNVILSIIYLCCFRQDFILLYDDVEIWLQTFMATIVMTPPEFVGSEVYYEGGLGLDLVVFFHMLFS